MKTNERPTVGLIYPHQLYQCSEILEHCSLIYLVEDPLFFRQYKFHKKKILFHRASMKLYQIYLEKLGKTVCYIDALSLEKSDEIFNRLAQDGERVLVIDPCDDWLERALRSGAADSGRILDVIDDPYELPLRKELMTIFPNGKKPFFNDFYIRQRRELNILISTDGPTGGKWNYDHDNREKLPDRIDIPRISPPLVRPTPADFDYVNKNFADYPGKTEDFTYPITFADSELWLNDFIDRRLNNFGRYEDAISSSETFVFHSVLSPVLNVCLIDPRLVVERLLKELDRVPINSIEGFIRQIIGWREYVRAVYRNYGRRQRTKNFFKHQRRLSTAFYSATTGIPPVDNTIQRVIDHAYCHHIERLMVLGNFMLLCEIHPDEIYQWFMEMFIDAYDWVMVPNVYGMSQYSDGGLITTKPYISGSSYVLKMSNYKKGDWTKIWDALYWNFISNNLDLFSSNHRTVMAASMCKKMGDKIKQHQQIANQFLSSL